MEPIKVLWPWINVNFSFCGSAGNERNDDSSSTKHADILWIIISFLERNLIIKKKKIVWQSSFSDGPLEARPAVVWSYPWHILLNAQFSFSIYTTSFVWPCKYPVGLFISLWGLCAKALQLICPGRTVFPHWRSAGKEPASVTQRFTEARLMQIYIEGFCFSV